MKLIKLKLGEVVRRKVLLEKKLVWRRFIVTSQWIRWDQPGITYVLTAIPPGMNAIDLGRSFPAALVERGAWPPVAPG